MKLAFCLFKYFPYGGLERDFIRIASLCRQHRHEIHVYTMAWQGEVPDGFRLTLVPVSGVTNHGRCASFARSVAPLIRAERYDVVAGFNRMPGLDVYYGADVCFEAEARERKAFWYVLTPRYRLYSAFESAVFSPKERTEILLISDQERRNYRKYHGTPEERLHMLPPGVSRDRVPASPESAAEARRAVRESLSIGPDGNVLLMVGSDYKRKGVDRSLRALASLPAALRENTSLCVVGKDDPRACERLARRLQVASQTKFLGVRDDVPGLLQAADVLLHPAYSENTGTAIVEALAAGLPVLATSVCGYAPHVERAGAGLLVSAPFQQGEMNAKLERALSSGELPGWRERALDYGKTTDLYGLVERAAEFIEDVGRRRSS